MCSIAYLWKLFTWIIILFCPIHAISKFFVVSEGWCFISFSSLNINILENFQFVFLNEDIQRFIFITKLFLNVSRCLRYTAKKVNFFLGHPVWTKQFGANSRFEVKCNSFQFTLNYIIDISAITFHSVHILWLIGAKK